MTFREYVRYIATLQTMSRQISMFSYTKYVDKTIIMFVKLRLLLVTCSFLWIHHWCSVMNLLPVWILSWRQASSRAWRCWCTKVTQFYARFINRHPKCSLYLTSMSHVILTFKLYWKKLHSDLSTLPLFKKFMISLINAFYCRIYLLAEGNCVFTGNTMFGLDFFHR